MTPMAADRRGTLRLAQTAATFALLGVPASPLDADPAAEAVVAETP
jgi:hypothetical protein